MRSYVLSKPNCFIRLVPALFCLIGLQEAGAVGGISNSKIVVPSAETVEKGRFEVEPFFALVFVDDSDDSVRFEGGGRFTIGALENLEVGANIGYLTVNDSNVIGRDTDFGDIEAGLKYRFLDQTENFPFSLAYQGGITFPTSGGDAEWVFELGGLILTKDFTDKFSMDSDFVFALIEYDAWSLVTEVGFGYFVTSWFQPVIEAAYSFESPENEENVHVFNVTAGFTAPVTDYLTIIIGVTTDVHTENTDEQVVLSAAFTFLF